MLRAHRGRRGRRPGQDDAHGGVWRMAHEPGPIVSQVAARLCALRLAPAHAWLPEARRPRASARACRMRASQGRAGALAISGDARRWAGALGFRRGRWGGARGQLWRVAGSQGAIPAKLAAKPTSGVNRSVACPSLRNHAHYSRIVSHGTHPRLACRAIPSHPIPRMHAVSQRVSQSNQPKPPPSIVALGHPQPAHGWLALHSLGSLASSSSSCLGPTTNHPGPGHALGHNAHPPRTRGTSLTRPHTRPSLSLSLFYFLPPVPVFPPIAHSLTSTHRPQAVPQHALSPPRSHSHFHSHSHTLTLISSRRV